MTTHRLALAITLLALCFLPCAAGTSRPAAAVTDLRYYAWYWDGKTNQVTYHELTSFPVDDDLDEYPDFDIVATVTNQDAEGPFTLETTLSYKIGPVTSGDGEASYARAKRQATWRKPLWTKRARLESLDAQPRRVRLAVLSIKDAIDRHWKGKQYPYRARFSVVLKQGEGKQARVLNRLSRELPIDMLD